ncbi:MAG: hypothetical protein ACYCO0_01530 [Candidatus Micrarchaeaceae archaeon]
MAKSKTAGVGVHVNLLEPNAGKLTTEAGSLMEGVAIAIGEKRRKAAGSLSVLADEVLPAKIESLKDELVQMQKLKVDNVELERVREEIEDLGIQKKRVEEVLAFFKSPDGVYGALELGDEAVKERLKWISGQLKQTDPDASIGFVMKRLDEDRAVVQGFDRKGTQVKAVDDAVESIDRFNLRVKRRLSEMFERAVYKFGKSLFGAGIDEQQEKVTEMLAAIDIDGLVGELKAIEMASVELKVLAGAMEAMKKEPGIGAIKAGRDFINKITDPDGSGKLEGDVSHYGLRDAIDKKEEMNKLADRMANPILVNEFGEMSKGIIEDIENIEKLGQIEDKKKREKLIKKVNSANIHLHIAMRVFGEGQDLEVETKKQLEKIRKETNEAIGTAAEKLGRPAESIQVDKISAGHIDMLRDALEDIDDFKKFRRRIGEVMGLLGDLGVDMTGLHETLKRINDAAGIKRSEEGNEENQTLGKSSATTIAPEGG